MLYTQHTQFLLNRQEITQKNNAKEDEEKMQPNGEKISTYASFPLFFLRVVMMFTH